MKLIYILNIKIKKMESNNNKQNINLEAYKTKMQTIFYNLDVKNNICPDCGKIKSMDFASINNGIIICKDCAKEHLSLGYNISFIHSLSEKWDDYLFNYIKVGGNTRFIQFCKDYKLDKEETKNINKKYKSKGLTYYREILRSEVLGYDPPENINVNKAFEEEENIPDNYPEFKKYSFVKHVDMNYLEKKFYTKKEEKNEEGFFGKIGDFFGNVKKNIGIGDWDIVKKVQEFNINDVKQKGADMFGYFFFGGNNNNTKKEEEDKKNTDDNSNEKKKDELNKVFGVKDKEEKENIIINNGDIKENNNIDKSEKNLENEEKEEKDSKKEINKDNEDKIEIKKEENKLTEEDNNNKINNINNNINNDNNDIEIDKNKENNIVENDINKEKEIVETKENNSNQNALEDILKDKNFINDNSKMNSEEKNELEKMLQE